MRSKVGGEERRSNIGKEKEWEDKRHKRERSKHGNEKKITRRMGGNNERCCGVGEWGGWGLRMGKERKREKWKTLAPSLVSFFFSFFIFFSVRHFWWKKRGFFSIKSNSIILIHVRSLSLQILRSDARGRFMAAGGGERARIFVGTGGWGGERGNKSKGCAEKLKEKKRRT